MSSLFIVLLLLLSSLCVKSSMVTLCSNKTWVDDSFILLELTLYNIFLGFFFLLSFQPFFICIFVSTDPVFDFHFYIFLCLMINKNQCDVNSVVEMALIRNESEFTKSDNSGSRKINWKSFGFSLYFFFHFSHPHLQPNKMWWKFHSCSYASTPFLPNFSWNHFTNASYPFIYYIQTNYENFFDFLFCTAWRQNFLV